MQSRWESLKEAASNSLTGTVISWLITVWILSMKLDLGVFWSSILICGSCTVASVIRGYFIRRHFNRKHQIGTTPDA